MDWGILSRGWSQDRLNVNLGQPSGQSTSTEPQAAQQCLPIRLHPLAARPPARSRASGTLGACLPGRLRAGSLPGRGCNRGGRSHVGVLRRVHLAEADGAGQRLGCLSCRCAAPHRLAGWAGQQGAAAGGAAARLRQQGGGCHVGWGAGWRDDQGCQCRTLSWAHVLPSDQLVGADVGLLNKCFRSARWRQHCWAVSRCRGLSHRPLVMLLPDRLLLGSQCRPLGKRRRARRHGSGWWCRLWRHSKRSRRQLWRNHSRHCWYGGWRHSGCCLHRSQLLRHSGHQSGQRQG